MNPFTQRLRWLTGTVLLGGALSVGALGLVGLVQGSDDKHEDERHDYREQEQRALSLNRDSRYGVDPMYSEECGACHLAYPAELLPARSWQALMAGLDDHFGENAELPADMANQIEQYLTAHAADQGSRLGNKFMRGLTLETPLRITGLPYFEHEHDEVPMRLVKDNPDVGSFSRCDACHQDPVQRGFDEDTVNIPGHGRWDD